MSNLLLRKREKHLHLAVKLSSLYPHFSPEHREASVQIVGQHLGDLLDHARETGTHMTVDAEDYQVAHLTEEIFLDVVTRGQLAGYDGVGIALQAYRKDVMVSAERIVSAAHERGAPITARLIKGAYWDTEAMIAAQNGWEFPLFEEKHETDRSFVGVARYLLANRDAVHLVCGTHNPQSIASVLELCEKMNIPTSELEFQWLYGIGNPVHKMLDSIGLLNRGYIPVGDLGIGMAYFARRLLENTANNGFMAKLL